MKTSLRLLSPLLAGSLLLAGAAIAQDAQPSNGQVIASADYTTPQGSLVVHSELAPAAAQTPPPSFEQLARGGKYVTQAMAASYPPLANDFDYANSNHSGKLTKAQYAHWLKQL